MTLGVESVDLDHGVWEQNIKHRKLEGGGLRLYFLPCFEKGEGGRLGHVERGPETESRDDSTRNRRKLGCQVRQLRWF